METGEPKPSSPGSAAEALVDYAIDREDVKWLMGQLHTEATVNRHTVEYELQILKIISVGWSIAYHLENDPAKQPLLEGFWKAVQAYAQSLSQTTELMIGQDIDYFQTLRERLDMYLAAMAASDENNEPATVIGPAFAQTCGNADDIFTRLTGAKMFMSVVGRVKTYLEKVAPPLNRKGATVLFAPVPMQPLQGDTARASQGIQPQIQHLGTARRYPGLGQFDSQAEHKAQPDAQKEVAPGAGPSEIRPQRPQEKAQWDEAYKIEAHVFPIGKSPALVFPRRVQDFFFEDLDPGRDDQIAGVPHAVEGRGPLPVIE